MILLLPGNIATSSWTIQPRPNNTLRIDYPGGHQFFDMSVDMFMTQVHTANALGLTQINLRGGN